MKAMLAAVILTCLSGIFGYSQSEIPHYGAKLPVRIHFIPKPDTYRQLKKEMKEKLGETADAEIIDITSSAIEYLPGRTIRKFRKVGSIGLTMPSLKVLPRQLGKMKKLSVLRLECSASLKLPSRFRKLSLSRLQFICTDSAESTSVSAVRKYNKLKGLEINAVTFGAFPEWIYEMDALEYLGLVHGNLTEIPTSINKMKGLKTIQFGKNALIALPKEFGELKLLAYVDLSNNNFAEFPVVLLELTELYDIDLSGNKIKTIPENITVLRKLISLDLRNNPISVEEQERIRQLLPDVRVYFN